MSVLFTHRLRWMPLLFLAAFSAMGDLAGEPEEDEVPKVDADFKATVLDRSGVSTTVRRISIEGKTYLSGQRGDGKVTIPFDRIAQVRFMEPEADKVLALVTLQDQRTVEIELKPKAGCFGATDFGTYRIQLRHLASVRIEGGPFPSAGDPPAPAAPPAPKP